MNSDEICQILTEVLGLESSRVQLTEQTALLGELPEFDSMAVVSVLTALEEQSDIIIEDAEIDASVFETVGTLTAFISAKAAS